MDNDLETGIRRLEMTLELLRNGNFGDWLGAYGVAGDKADDSAENSDDWLAIRDLIVVATHGAPVELSYMDEEFKAMVEEAGKNHKSAPNLVS